MFLPGNLSSVREDEWVASAEFLARLLVALSAQNFRFTVESFDPTALVADGPLEDGVESVFTAISNLGGTPQRALAFGVANAILGQAIGFELPSPDAFDVEPRFSATLVDASLRETRGFAVYSGFKFMLGQPVFVAVIDGDLARSHDLRAIGDHLDEITQSMLGTSAKSFGVRLGSFSVPIFAYDVLPDLAEWAEIKPLVRRIRVWKKTQVLPWAIGADGLVMKHGAFPHLTAGVLSADELTRGVSRR